MKKTSPASPPLTLSAATSWASLMPVLASVVAGASVASVASILYSTAYVRSDAVDPEQILAWFTGETCRGLLDRAESLREKGVVPPKQIFDVRYADFVTRPIETVADVYRHFGIEYGDGAREDMRSYLDAKPKGRHGAHRYDFEHTGFDIGSERERFADYVAKYELPEEV